MKLLFRQRLFSWFDSYDIYDESGRTVFTVKGQLSWGHMLHILDANGNHIATVKEVVLTFLPKFEMYIGNNYIGKISKELTFFSPKFSVECNGWNVQGDFMGWDYTVTDPNGLAAAYISKELFNFTDTYVIDVPNPGNALISLMIVLAIDAEKCPN